MNSRTDALFLEALQIPAGAKRDAFLDESCRDDAKLRRQLGDMLEDDTAADAFFDGPDTKPAPADGLSVCGEKPGDMIGRYQLRQIIGEGGFGTVWMAEQTEPVERQVALKIIRIGMDTREFIARFEQERQALAMMDHPNIARVLDGGATPHGRPYFVMELLRGVPITKFCDEQKLPLAARLNLFVEVCGAIQHAHQKGVIHRDIKPSNVMITLDGDKAVTKVIDFGVAKATQGKLTDKTVFTRFEQFIGTPVYMSPEQAGLGGLDVDTRCDIYALGILLYELLTGKPPFDAKSLAAAGYEEMRRIIREVEPPKPSSKLSTVVGEERTTLANARHIEPEKLSRMVEPDLDWIVMKAIEKDRTRRYETVNGLALDIQRFLSDEPVVAAAPSAFYRVRKFARRHKTGFWVSVSIVSILIAATIISAWLAVRATKAEELASNRLIGMDRARKEAEGAFSFLTELFQSSDPLRDGRKVTFAETLERAATKLETDPDVPPERRAKLQGTIGWTYQSIGLFQEAVPLLEKSCNFYLAVNGEDHPETVLAMHNLAYALFRNGQEDEALKLREKILPRSRDTLGPHHQTLLAVIDMVTSPGPAFTGESEKKEAANLLEDLRQARLSGLESPKALIAMARLAHFYNETGNPFESLRLWELVVPLCEKQNGRSNYLTFGAMQGKADALSATGRKDDAIKLEEEILSQRKTNLGVDHLDTITGMHNLADSLAAAGRRSEAIKIEEDALSLCENRYGKEQSKNFSIMTNLADFHADAGRLRQSLAYREKVCAFYYSKNQPESLGTLGAMSALARTLTLLQEFERAENLLVGVLDKYRKSNRPADCEVRLKDMAELRFRQKRFAEAEALNQERIHSRRDRSGWETSTTIFDANLDRGRLFAEWAWSERATGAPAAAEHSTMAVTILGDALAANLRDKVAAAQRRPDALSRLGWARFVATLIDPGLTAGERETNLAEAERHLLDGQSGMEKEKATKYQLERDGFERLVRFYEARNKQEKAAEWKAKLSAFDSSTSR